MFTGMGDPLADIDGNGTVDGIDLSAVLGSFGQTCGTSCPVADLNSDGVVDVFYLNIIVLGKFGNVCP